MKYYRPGFYMLLKLGKTLEKQALFVNELGPIQIVYLNTKQKL